GVKPKVFDGHPQLVADCVEHLEVRWFEREMLLGIQENNAENDAARLDRDNDVRMGLGVPVARVALICAAVLGIKNIAALCYDAAETLAHTDRLLLFHELQRQ